ncbi:MAG: hypothetical protein LDL31_12100 [Prosthecobacter sp.]|nr:hypothetical protein [Prosthecobacter sp.]
MPRAWYFFLFTAMAHAQTCACTIPVFRYALDRWEPDPLTLRIPPAQAQEPLVVDLLRPLRANGKANLTLKTVADPLLQDAELRDSKNSPQALWSGKLDAAALGALLNSPARQALLQRILAGESVVWVLVDGGQPGDAAEMQRIQERLKFLEQVAALPVQDPNDPDSQLGPGPALRLAFSTYLVRASDPAEQLLVRMLAGPEAVGGPGRGFAAAVFGRGRVLGAWPLEKLDDAALEDACMYLVGRCSCRVKNQNPGWDLLLDVDWAAALQSAQSAGPVPTVAHAAEMPASELETAVTLPAPVAGAGAVDRSGVPQVMILLCSAGLLLAAVVILWKK